MGKAFFSSEIEDPDLDWLISNFLNERSNYTAVEVEQQVPMVLLPHHVINSTNKKVNGTVSIKQNDK